VTNIRTLPGHATCPIHCQWEFGPGTGAVLALYKSTRTQIKDAEHLLPKLWHHPWLEEKAIVTTVYSCPLYSYRVYAWNSRNRLPPDLGLVLTDPDDRTVDRACSLHGHPQSEMLLPPLVGPHLIRGVVGCRRFRAADVHAAVRATTPDVSTWRRLCKSYNERVSCLPFEDSLTSLNETELFRPYPPPWIAQEGDKWRDSERESP
jgi:hypothetical protein